MIHSSTLYTISKIAFVTIPLSASACLIVHYLPTFFGNFFSIKNFPISLFGFLNRIVWGAKYIVKINETWVLARGWKMKNGNVSIIFEPYKQTIIGFKAGHVYEIADPSCWYKVPICWNNDNIYHDIIKRNIMSLKEKHPNNNLERDRQPAPYPFHRVSRMLWRNMSQDEMEQYISRYMSEDEMEQYISNDE